MTASRRASRRVVFLAGWLIGWATGSALLAAATVVEHLQLRRAQRLRAIHDTEVDPHR